MQTFKVMRYEGVEYPPMQFSQIRGHGVRAPGRVIMVLQEGSGWVMRQNGVREDIAAKTVVFWDADDWMEYGSDGCDKFKAESYWSADFSEEEWAARMAEIFGSEAPG